MNIYTENQLPWGFDKGTIMDIHTLLKLLSMKMILKNINSDTSLMILTVLLPSKIVSV